MADSDMIVGLIAVQFAVFVGKIAWDWVQAGRVNKSDYLTKKDFAHHHETCCVHDIKRQLTEHVRLDGISESNVAARMTSVEKRLDAGQADFHELRKSIGNIEKQLARITSVLEFRFGQKVEEVNDD